MTRLKEEDIACIAWQLKEYDHELQKKTGHSLAEIAAHAVGLQTKAAHASLLGRIAVIPVTSGQGIISGFSRTVAGILDHLGVNTFVTAASDVGGFAEAIERGTETIFLADDDRFIAVNLKLRVYSDNSDSTGKGYAAALDYMTGGLKDKSVLVLGAGPVGRSAALSIIGFGGEVHIYDKSERASSTLSQLILDSSGRKIYVEHDLTRALEEHRRIIVACPEAGFITNNYLHADSYVAAPGVPLGIHPAALNTIWPRLIHDPLQLGVATMCYDLLNSIISEGGKER